MFAFLTWGSFQLSRVFGTWQDRWNKSGCVWTKCLRQHCCPFSAALLTLSSGMLSCILSCFPLVPKMKEQLLLRLELLSYADIKTEKSVSYLVNILLLKHQWLITAVSFSYKCIQSGKIPNETHNPLESFH